mmetsp:Transcript_40379/g.114315  ORF Transcript_40379/g.114315 Transcript_40379/m.114315 type:complete len:184 (-) Transcript_40379:679-1230(-)
MASENTTSVVKRLSYGDLPHHKSDFSDVPEVSLALRNPSIESLKGALEAISAANSRRFSHIIETAQKQASHGDASDLKRLTKQLSMAKDNFQAYDVQAEFMSGTLGYFWQPLSHERFLVVLATDVVYRASMIPTCRAQEWEARWHGAAGCRGGTSRPPCLGWRAEDPKASKRCSSRGHHGSYR